jgi:hypothetical protein
LKSPWFFLTNLLLLCICAASVLLSFYNRSHSNSARANDIICRDQFERSGTLDFDCTRYVYCGIPIVIVQRTQGVK